MKVSRYPLLVLILLIKVLFASLVERDFSSKPQYQADWPGLFKGWITLSTG